MSNKRIDRTQEMPAIPKVELDVKPASMQIKPGEPVTLSWKVYHADQVYLVQRPPGIPGLIGVPSVQWAHLDETSKQVEPQGEVTLQPKVTTAYILAVKGPSGRLARTVIIDVVSDKLQPAEDAHTWYETGGLPDIPDISPEIDRTSETWERMFCAIVGPRIDLLPANCCAFLDEEITRTWHITCAYCASMDVGIEGATLVEDETRRSGTELRELWFGGSFLPLCDLPLRDALKLSTEIWGPADYGCRINAVDSFGRWDSATHTICFLPHPSIDGCDEDRKGEIEKALLDVCRHLIGGCILDNRALDADVGAFRLGLLSRAEVWRQLRYQLWNLNLLSFSCNEIPDADWTWGARWTEYTNKIELFWSPSHRPDPLPYMILHELLHKVGFNGDLLAHFSELEIDHQTNRVARSCYPEAPRLEPPPD